MPFTTATRDAVMDGTSIAALCTHASLHTADPTTTGGSEVAGGSYARVAITWAAASGGTKTLTGSVTINVPSGTTITHFGLWSALAAGTFRGGGTLSASQSYPTGGTYALTITVTST
ncbi:phage tail fiber protein [Spirillospora sp. CA-253888]